MRTEKREESTVRENTKTTPLYDDHIELHSPAEWGKN